MVYWTEHGSVIERDDGDPSLSLDALVTRAQDGSQQAFEILYARYNRQINNYLHRMVGNDSIGYELTQDVFLKAWSALPGLRTPALFVSWLYRIALNCACDYQKRLKRMHVVSLDTYVEGAGALSVEGPEEGVEKNELLQLALSQVSPIYRSCLILYVIEELSQRQIAERLNIKEVCVSKYVSRGKEELRQVYHRLLSGQSSLQTQGRRSR